MLVAKTAEWHTGTVSQIAFSPDGGLLAVAVPHGIHLFEISTRTPLRFFVIERGVWTVAFSPGGQMLAAGLWDHTVLLLRLSDGALVRKLIGHTHEVASVAFSPDGRWLASGSKDHTVRLWRPENGALIHVLTGHTDEVTSLIFSPDGTLLASGSQDKTVRIWRSADGACIRCLGGHLAGV
jgi:WD40 repeat protein